MEVSKVTIWLKSMKILKRPLKTENSIKEAEKSKNWREAAIWKISIKWKNFCQEWVAITYQESSENKNPKEKPTLPKKKHTLNK